MTVATGSPAGWTVAAPCPVGDVAILLARLGSGGETVALGVDFPLGLPRAYAARHASAVDFPAFLRGLAHRPGFFTVCDALDELAPERPFYPRRGAAGMTRLSHAAALGLGDAAGLSRLCDRATAHRPAGAPLFWTLGANQSGKAAISAWRDLLLPALAGDDPPALWPFDGALLALLRPGRTVVAETYPAEAMRQLGLRMGGSKRRQSDRAALADPLRGAMAALSAVPDAAMAAATATGFGADAAGEDRFDSVLGLLCILGVLAGRRPDTAPADPWVQRWEGWVLGQTASPIASCPPSAFLLPLPLAGEGRGEGGHPAGHSAALPSPNPLPPAAEGFRSERSPPMPAPRPVMLVILDGWGWSESDADNAVRQARTPNFDRLWAGPHAFLRTSGGDVGLPDGQMGNSEVGHLNIGAGRIVMQDLPRIGRAIADGSLAQMPAVRGLVEALRKSGGTCHLLGLVSTGGVHSHQDHAAALARIVAAEGIPVRVHVFTDGRDAPPRSAPEFIAKLEAALPPGAVIATVCGRYFALDRDNRWERVSRAYALLANGEGDRFATAEAVIQAAHAAGTTDEFIPPAAIGDYRGMAPGDALLSFNYRADRIRELLAALVDPAFTGFPRTPPNLAAAVGMTRYSDDLAPFMTAIFPPQPMDAILGQVASEAGKRQLRLAETEKYPHVTYFLNGGREQPFPGEERIMVPSPKVATYDLQPEMSAPELTRRAVEAIGAGQFDLLVLNFANADMVGHTGSLPAAIKAVEAVDAGLGAIANSVAAQGGALLVTADHGNAEQMRDPVTGEPHTAHTVNRVPVMLVAPAGGALRDGRLGDLAPTLLDLMGVSQPPEMTGQSLLTK